ncbi:MAG TPA: VTT domain-containing protein [Phycisphaerales bacterium]|nr:VTT domain-containing protein [Phycisphaerales bacterium]
MPQDHEQMPPATDPVAPEAPLPPAPAPAEQPTLGQVFRRLGPAGYLAVAWTAMPALGGILLLANIGTIADWLRGHQQLGLAMYVGIFILSAGFGMLPTYSQSLLAGWAFGLALGFPAALSGFVGAAMLGYIVARTASEDRAERLIAENVKARAVRDALIGHGFWKTLGIVTLLRVPPNSPFALTNLAMASTGVSKRAFIVGTALGMAPRTFIAVWLATQVQNLADDSVPKPMWLKVGGVASVVVVFVILYMIGNHAVKRVTGGTAPTEPRP